MHPHRIIDLMNPEEHCPACGALLVFMSGGDVCAHCGFSSSTELEEPAEGLVLAFRMADVRRLDVGRILGSGRLAGGGIR